MILIIDDNVMNCENLAFAARTLSPIERVVVLRVTSIPFGSPAVPMGVEVTTVTSVAEAATVVLNLNHDLDERLVVFYDLQLLGVQESEAQAQESALTASLASLVSSKHSIFVDIHSSSVQSRDVAARIDPEGCRTIWYHGIANLTPDEVETIVGETLALAHEVDGGCRREPGSREQILGVSE